MNFDLIDKDGPMNPGWGRVWLGSWIDDPKELRKGIPAPLFIVSVNNKSKGNDYSVIDHEHEIEGLISLAIQDDAQGVLAPNILVAVADSIIAILSRGINIYAHCLTGKHRSPYIVAAVRMRALGETAEQALTAISIERPQIKPHRAFILSLHQLQSYLSPIPEGYPVK